MKDGRKAEDGSSPPTRGTLIATSAEYNNNRIIPAYAGNTRLRQWSVG